MPSCRPAPRKLIVLDRDGVINHDSDQFIKSPDEWRPIPGSLEAIARLNHAGFRVVVATNQSGVGRGLLDIATLNAIHEQDARALAQVGGRVDAVFFCPHTADSQCRVPQAEAGHAAGDRRPLQRRDGRRAVRRRQRLRDLQAAADAVGAQPMLVLTGKGEKTLREGRLPEEHGDLSRPRVRRVGVAGGRLTSTRRMVSALRSIAVRCCSS